MPTWESVIWNLPPLQLQAKAASSCHFPAASQITAGNQVLNEAGGGPAAGSRQDSATVSLQTLQKSMKLTAFSCFVITGDSVINITAAQRQQSGEAAQKHAVHTHLSCCWLAMEEFSTNN